MQRVVVTGMGAVTPVGNSVSELWDSICAGRHGIAPIEGIETEGLKVALAAQVKDFNPEDYMTRKEAHRMDPFTRYAFAAARQAVEDSGTNFRDDDPYRVGVLIGSGIGGLQTTEADHQKFLEKGPGRVPALMIPMMISNMAPGMIAIAYGFKGVNYAVTSACSSSTHAVGEAMRCIRDGRADVMLTGGAEATITTFSLAAFGNMTALSTSRNPDRASIPFDIDRDGFVMGDGSGMMVLESLDHAKARGAKIYAELAGYGATCDAYHITSPEPDGAGACRAMQLAAEDAGVTPEQIGYINAHGTSTKMNDRCETAAIHRFFGGAKPCPVSSTKSMTGHMLGAAGAVETIITALALQNGILPPTANYCRPDPFCDLDYITEGARKADVKAALSNTFGFGGHNATVCLKKYEG